MKGTDMDMDDRFANGAYIDGAADYPDRWNSQAETFRRSVLADLDVPYGPSPRQVMDIFYPNRLAKGLVVFVHGGYWRMFDKSSWSHLAAGALERGWAVAMPSYDLCPNVRISEIVVQVKAAVQLAAARVAGPIRLSGHSAGGQVVARLAGMNWNGRLVRVVPISPITDLIPLMQTKMQEDFQLTKAEAVAESPVCAPAPDVPLTLWVGANERPVFIEQAQTLGAIWGCSITVAPQLHHFNVIDGLANADSHLTDCLFS